MIKLWKILGYFILAAVLAVFIALYSGSVKHNKTLKLQVKDQGVIIDSLLKRKTYTFDVKLNVTDRSRSIIYGRYNKGSISMPQERTYTLTVDSANFTVK
jgi:hypothetical protein